MYLYAVDGNYIEPQVVDVGVFFAASMHRY